MVAIDEIHVCKGVDTAQGSNMLKLSKLKYKIGMTGTLLTNSPRDAYMPLKWIGVEKACYSTFDHYYTIYTGPFKNVFSGYKNLDVLKKQISNHSLRRKAEGNLSLPPFSIIEEYVEMSPKQAAFYHDVEAGIVEEVDKVKITTTTLLAMVSRLREVTVLPGMLTTSDIPSAKIDRACELIENVVQNGHKVVVFSVFKEPLRELSKRLHSYNPSLNMGGVPDIVIDSNIDKFQTDPESKIFIASCQKCGTGITLTAACYAIFLDTP